MLFFCVCSEGENKNTGVVFLGLLVLGPHNSIKYDRTLICDPLCENPAKDIFCDLLFSTKIILHKVKNILWKCNLYIFNIDLVRPCQNLKL